MFIYYLFILICYECTWGRESHKTSENTVASLKFMPSFTFSKAFQWTTLEPLMGRFWTLGLMFDTPGLDSNAKFYICSD